MNKKHQNLYENGFGELETLTVVCIYLDFLFIKQFCAVLAVPSWRHACRRLPESDLLQSTSSTRSNQDRDCLLEEPRLSTVKI